MDEALLIQTNINLVKKIALSFHPNDTDLYDFIQVGTIGLLKAIRAITKKDFSKYSSRCIRNEIVAYIKHNSIKYDSLVDIQESEKINIKEYLPDNFTGEECRVIHYFLMGCNFTEIGNLCGTTRKTAKKQFNSAVQKCRKS